MTLATADFIGRNFLPGRVGENRPIVYFEDFTRAYTEFDAVSGEGDWLVTQVGSGTLPVQTDEHGGAVTMTTGAVAGDSINAQLVGEVFRMDNGDELYFEARFNVSTSADFYMGMATTDSALGTVVDGVMFRIEATSTLFWRVEKDSGGTDTTTASTLTDDTYATVAFKCRGDKVVEFFLDGVRVAVVDTPTNFPDNEELTPSFLIQSNGAAETLKIDYILVVNDRP